MVERTETVVISQSLPLERLDTYLRREFPVVSRGTIQRLIDEGAILINGKQVKATHHPRAGEIVTVHWPQPRTAEAQPEDIPLCVLFEDEHFLVIDKGSGVVVHPSAGHEEHTLVNALLHHCHGQLSGIGGVARPGIVHRLDKDTSGCLVVAKTDSAHQALASQLANRKMEKIYNALVCGVLSQKAGEIRAAIARHPTHRKRMATIDGGRDAWTSYRLVTQAASAAFVEATLHTGRTHQIRVHFQHIGHPVVGDDVYGRRQNQRFVELTGYDAPRQMLHARRISFLHPATGRLLAVEAPVPSDMDSAMEALHFKE